MATSFPATLAGGQPDVKVEEMALVAGATFTVGALLVYTPGATATWAECTGSPVSIGGLALSPAPGAASVTRGLPYQANQIPIALLDESTQVEMASATTPAATHIGNEYGVVKSGNNWLVNISDTTNKAVLVIKIDITNGVFWVRFLASVLQFIAA